MLSFVVAGIACGFAALCYAELAAMIPVLAIGLSIYFAYSVRHSKLRRGFDTGITEDIPPPLIKT